MKLKAMVVSAFCLATTFAMGCSGTGTGGGLADGGTGEGGAASSGSSGQGGPSQGGGAEGGATKPGSSSGSATSCAPACNRLGACGLCVQGQDGNCLDVASCTSACTEDASSWPAAKCVVEAADCDGVTACAK